MVTGVAFAVNKLTKSEPSPPPPPPPDNGKSVVETLKNVVEIVMMVGSPIIGAFTNK